MNLRRCKLMLVSVRKRALLSEYLKRLSGILCTEVLDRISKVKRQIKSNFVIALFVPHVELFMPNV